MKSIFIQITLFMFVLVAFSCSKSGGNMPVIPPPADTVVVTPPIDTTVTQPPKDTTTTPPEDTSTAPYTNVLVGTFNGLVITTDAAMDTTIAEFSTPGVVDMSLQSYGGTLSVAAELHAKQPMTVTSSGSQQFVTWSDVKQVTDVHNVEWMDTANHPYVKIINKNKKENVYCLFIQNVVNSTTGVVAFSLPAGIPATNETYNKLLSKNLFYAVRYFHD